ncbi:hypothetical protein QN277_001598 [Acacia crassicarpa]|uniref:Uncharacterized protein n=1 Tax=Acacia crassicarpa TaxID=499986 RepID=A0AAE1N8S6_9FABA|nr:hypothetical protein QN277_001598 [Acacia crassicarpa]
MNKMKIPRHTAAEASPPMAIAEAHRGITEFTHPVPPWHCQRWAVSRPPHFSPFTSSNPLPEEGPHKPGLVGKPMDLEMAILNEKGEIQKAEVKGEVCIRVRSTVYSSRIKELINRRDPYQI